MNPVIIAKTPMPVHPNKQPAITIQRPLRLNNVCVFGIDEGARISIIRVTSSIYVHKLRHTFWYQAQTNYQEEKIVMNQTASIAVLTIIVQSVCLNEASTPICDRNSCPPGDRPAWVMEW
jgi:hypothetical protein